MDKTVYVCPFAKGQRRKPEMTCAIEFAEQHHPRLSIEKTDDDGNCFFHSLQIYGEKTNHPLLFNKSIPDMREEITVYAREHMEDIFFFLALNDTNESPMDIIERIRVDGEWDSQIGDIIPAISPHVFGINLVIYNVYRNTDGNSQGNKHPDIVTRRLYLSHPDAPVFYLLRIHDGHYQPMIPIDDHHSASASSSRHVNRSHHLVNENQKVNLQNQLNSITSSMAHVRLANSPTHKKTSVAKKASKSSSTSKKTVSTRKKKVANTNTNLRRKEQRQQFQFLINQIRNMNNESVNKQNAIMSVVRNIQHNHHLTINNKNDLLNQL
jgi:hypothetical protein